MSPEQVGALGLGVMLVLLIAGVHVGLALGLVAFVGFILLGGTDAALGAIGTTPFNSVASYTLSVVPMFIIMGSFISHARFSQDLFSTGCKWLGHLPGGLAVATTAACAIFSAASGSSAATTATIGKVCIPEMRRYGYDPKLAAGTVAVAGGLAIMIPPSINLVVYGLLTDVSIGKLLIAGYLPGILLAFSYCAAIWAWVKLNPRIAPQVTTSRPSWREKIISLKGTWGILTLGLFVMGVIYTGAATPTEAAGAGAILSLLLALALKRMSWSKLRDSLVDTALITAMLFLTILGAFLFAQFLAMSYLPFAVAEFVAKLQVPSVVIVLMFVILYLIEGLFLNPTTMMVLTLPVAVPILMSLGYDLIWFGIITTIMCEVAMVTPPFGQMIFVTKGVAPDIPLADIYKGSMPFLLGDTAVMLLLFVFPQIALFLPSMMK